MRTEEEIIARIKKVEPHDLFGFRQEVLICALSAESARPFCVDGADLSDWVPLQGDELASRRASYLAFAFEKAENHRGLSAGRSVDKLSEMAWLSERDDVVAAMDAAGYAQYGVPKLVVFARGFELEVPASETLARMAEGDPCTPGCMEGCS